MYSQNNEEQIIEKYFSGRFKLNVLDIGANDGKTLSNTRRAIELGAFGVLVEPSIKAFERLKELYPCGVSLINAAIGTEDKNGILLESDSLLSDEDVALVSSAIESETKRWKKNKFTEQRCEFITFKTLLELSPVKTFGLISIDAEGMDYEILSQIDLKEVECEMLIVEHNGKNIDWYIAYCEQFGMKELARNAENLIMAL